MSTALARAVAKAPWWRRLLAWLGGNARPRCGPCAQVGEDNEARADGYCMACWLRRDIETEAARLQEEIATAKASDAILQLMIELVRAGRRVRRDDARQGWRVHHAGHESFLSDEFLAGYLKWKADMLTRPLVPLDVPEDNEWKLRGDYGRKPTPRPYPLDLFIGS